MTWPAWVFLIAFLVTLALLFCVLVAYHELAERKARSDYYIDPDGRTVVVPRRGTP